MSIPTVDSILYGGKSAVVSDLAGLNAMLSNDNAEVSVTLSDDVAVNASITVPESTKVKLDLGGKTLSAPGSALRVHGG